jgi:phage/plasmid-like protein (TIGR03299 family)
MERMPTQLKTSAQMISEAGLSWRVLQAPVLFEGNGLKKYSGKLVNFRDDTGEPLGIVSPTYKIVQNSTAFAFLDSLLGDSIEQYVKAGSWQNGSKVYIRVKLPGDITFAGNPDDKGIKYVDFNTSHDGSKALEASLMAYRLVCSNGLKMFKAIAGGKMRHTQGMSLDKLRMSLNLMNGQFDIMEKLSNQMSQTAFESKYIPQVLEKVGLIPAEEKRSTRALNILTAVEALYNGEGKGSRMQGSRGTRWGIYNAITEYIDHRRGSDAGKREESATIGQGATVKEKALEVLSA